MEKITTREALKMTIDELQLIQESEYILLKEQVMETYHSFSLGKIFKRAINNVVTMPGLGNKILLNAAGVTAGIVTKKIVMGKTANPLLKLLGFALQVSVADNVIGNAEKVKTLGKILMNKLFNKRTTPTAE